MDDSTKEAARSHGPKLLPAAPMLLPAAPVMMPAQPNLLPVPYHDPELDSGMEGEGYRVLLFNDESHSMDEVVVQLIKAIQCTFDIAAAIMLRAHTKGQAIVTITGRREATRIADILREIALLVSVDRM